MTHHLERQVYKKNFDCIR